MQSRSRLWRVGGGIGSGKSALTQHLGRLGAITVEADVLGHLALERVGGAFDEVRRTWPESVIDGVIHRPTLGRVVFADPVALRRLESIVHPAIAADIECIVQHTEGYVVLELAILKRLTQGVWPLIFVDAPEDLRLERATRRGLSEDDVRRRMAAQPTRAEWLAEATIVVPNDGDLAGLGERAIEVAESIGLLDSRAA